jgi:hypothetical protein
MGLLCCSCTYRYILPQDMHFDLMLAFSRRKADVVVSSDVSCGYCAVVVPKGTYCRKICTLTSCWHFRGEKLMWQLEVVFTMVCVCKRI